jgi:nucleoid-associated protein YgaU
MNRQIAAEQRVQAGRRVPAGRPSGRPSGSPAAEKAGETAGGKAGRRTRLRLTRRGRWACALAAALVCSGGWAVAQADNGGATAVRFVVVEPGDSLWSIASEHVGGDIREAVVRIGELNGLASGTIQAGARLLLPE